MLKSNKLKIDKSATKTENIWSNTNKKITEFIKKSNNSQAIISATKHTSDILSPPENSRDSKKMNIELDIEKEIEQKQEMSNEHRKGEVSSEVSNTMNIQHILGPLMKEFKLLREIVDKNYVKLDEVQRGMSLHQSKDSQELHNLEHAISIQRAEIIEEIGEKLENTNWKMETILLENKYLKKENQNLREHLDQLKIAHLSNNVIITGIEEQTWEVAEVTKQRVYDTIATTIDSPDGNVPLEETYKVDVAYCSRVGKYRPNVNRPITVTFQ